MKKQMGKRGRRKRRKLKANNLETEVPIRLDNDQNIINVLKFLVRPQQTTSSSTPSSSIVKLTKAKIFPALFPFYEEPENRTNSKILVISNELETESHDDNSYCESETKCVQRKLNYYRGICCNAKVIKTGSEILRIPEEFLITLHSLPPEIRALEKLNGHSKLAFYLLLESSKGNLSNVKPYLDTLPSDFKSHPSYLSTSVQSSLPSFYQNLLANQCDSISIALHVLRKHFEGNDKVLKLLTFDSFRHFWYCVYTRSVYYDDTVKLSSDDGDETKTLHGHSPISSQEKQDDHMALAPFLDLFNHSPVPNTMVTFEVAKSPSSESRHHSRFYVIRAIKPIRKFEEIFISYGNHANYILWADYGFVPKISNPHNYIPVSFVQLLKSLSFFQSVLTDKRKAEIAHRLTSELNLMENDVSYNLAHLIAVYLWNPSVSSKLPYVDPSCPEYRRLLTLIIEHEIATFNLSAESLRNTIDDANGIDGGGALKETLVLLENSTKLLQLLIKSL